MEPKKELLEGKILNNQRELFFPEIQHRFLEPNYEIRFIAAGGGGAVYQVGENRVIKVMFGKHIKEVDKYQKIMSDIKAISDINPLYSGYATFFMHSTFILSTEYDTLPHAPKYIYEELEYFDCDLKQFCLKKSWTFEQMICILCQIINGLVLFHKLGFIMTDLKMQNIMIKPSSGKVVFIDFFDSLKITTQEKQRFMFTFHAKRNKNTTAEDVWRVGLLMLQFLFYKSNDIMSQQNKLLLKDEVQRVGNMLRKKTNNTWPPYNFNTLRTHFQNIQRIIYNSSWIENVHKEYIDEIFSFIREMLDTVPRNRPSLTEIIGSDLFLYHCMKPRTNFNHIEWFPSQHLSVMAKTIITSKPNSLRQNNHRERLSRKKIFNNE